MKSLDAFGKPVREFQVKTTCGGYLSILSFIVIGFLFVSQFKYYLEPETKDEMIIDQNQDRKYVNITFDVTFKHVPCSVLYLNLIDSKKANVLHVVHEIYKTRLSKSGKPIGNKIRDSLRNVAITSAELQEAGSRNSTLKSPRATSHFRCGSCFQSHIDEDDCCSTCGEVREAFKSRGLPQPQDYIFEQCEEEAYKAAKPEEQEGCRIDARLHVRKVAATIHFGVGRNFRSEFIEKGVDRQELVTHLDFHHEIHSLSFGPDFPGLNHVLDGRIKDHHLPQLTEHFQYDIHVIPTRYEEEGEEAIASHQYSVTEYVKNIDETQRHQELVACGLWANYDFTPFEVKVSKFKKSFTHFLTECCAILGGIFAFTGMLDNFSYRINKSMAKSGLKSKGGAMQLAAMSASRD